MGFQESPEPSLELIEFAGAASGSAIIDIGGGASRLVDTLVSRGYTDVTVLDLSGGSFRRAELDSAIAGASRALAYRRRRRRGVADPDLRHLARIGRAFHFLTDEGDRVAYVARLRRALRNNGHVIIGTFALDGPETCSGLPVARDHAVGLGDVLGEGFTLIDTRRHEQRTPRGSTQRFQFSCHRRQI